MNIAVFASGRGSNFEAILSAIHRGNLPARVCVVISNNSGAGALEVARTRNIPGYHISQRQFPSEDAFVAKTISVLQDHNVDFVALAGYMKKLSPKLIGRYRNRIANVHPALLPAFGGPGMYGIRVHEAVLQSGVKVTGATVHLVDEEYDRGPIVMQKIVAVSPTDTPVTLAAKVLEIEHEIYPLALKAFAEKRIRIQGNTVWIQ
ncbi:MAG: phosphoribosylglycinamide formyltransferase [Ignavibacteriales bacterium]|nr:phosphoribosylglycinamide formyltransferase [Ignavibacteriales bacterium]